MNELSISNLQPLIQAVDAPTNKEENFGAPDTPFSDFVKNSLENVNRQMLRSDQAIEDLTTGKNQDVHGTMIAMQKAEVSFELVMQVRNKLMSAYDEIRKMSI